VILKIRRIGTKGLFHAFRSMKKYFPCCSRHCLTKRSSRTSLCGMGTQIKRRKHSKDCVELCYTCSLSLENLPVFSVSVDPERILTNF